MPDKTAATLRAEKGVPDLPEITLGEQVYQLGSSTEADVVLDNPYVSRLHAQIVREGNRFRIRDLRSKNGTFVNGSRVGEEGEWLRNGDRIELSLDQVVLTFSERSGTLTLAVPQATGSSLVVDAESREVWVRGVNVDPPLSRKEFDILNLLYERRGKACSRDEIAVVGWPERTDTDVSEQEIDQYIRRLRLRVEEEPSQPKHITTVRRFGYKLLLS